MVRFVPMALKARVWSLRLGSASLLLFGAGWLVERVFGLEFMPL